MADQTQEDISEIALGPMIKRLRVDCGFTQVNFAAALGLTPVSINRYEAGTTKPSIENISKLYRFAVDHKHGPAEFIFSRVLKPSVFNNFNVPFELGVALGRASLAVLQGHAIMLSDEQITFVLALERLLADKSNQNKMVYDILRVLLSPYLSEAEDLIQGAVAAPPSTKVKSSKAR